MALARAFTKRSKRPDISAPSPSPAWPPRSVNTSKANQSIDRTKISSPVELLSTTNMLSYNAPDLPRRQMSSSSSTTSSSADDSDRSSSSNLSRETLTDASSVESSPTSSKPNSSAFFPPTTKEPRRSTSSANSHRKSLSAEGVPAIPQRALSHSKHAHEQLARKRSLHHMSSARNSREHRVSREQRSSVDMFRGSVEPNHPFGKELEQLNEVVEEFHGVIRDAAMDEDLSIIREKGLVRLCAADYLNEIEPLFLGMFETRLLTVNAAWI